MASEPTGTAIGRGDLVSVAAVVGRDWTHGVYYDEAEAAMESQWANVVWPLISRSDFGNVLEIAAGHGRNTSKLAQISGKVTATDINETNVTILSDRFADAANVEVRLNNGADLRFIPGGSISFAYCFDAMVHFDSDIVRAYIREIRRILRPGGRGFCHVSAFDGNPTGTYRDHPGWRNFMSRALFEHWLAKEGLRPLKSHYMLGVGEISDNPEGADCICYFELPSDSPAGESFVGDEVSDDAVAEASALREQLSALREALDSAKGRADSVDGEVADLRQQAMATTERLKTVEAELQTIHASYAWRVIVPFLRQVRGKIRF